MNYTDPTQNFFDWKWKDSNDGDRNHLLNCWRIPDCGNCVKSDHSCGWCPYSGICVPLEKHDNLLSPIRKAHICPMPWQERWELRTGTFGCNCSTTTFLAALITCVSTLLSLLVLWLLVKLVIFLIKLWRRNRNGVLLEFEDGQERELVWVRKRASWAGWWKSLWRRKTDVITEQEDLLG